MTKLQNIKEDLEDLEIYIREFSAFLPLAVCAVNPLGMIINVNKAAEDLTGYKSFEIVGEHVTSIFLEKKKIEKIEEIVKKRAIHGKELALVVKKRKKIPVNVSVSGRRDKAGNYIGYFLAFSDITEIKALQGSLERKVRERTKELQKRVGDLERFHKLTIGRELKMVELKKRIKELKEGNKELNEK